MRSTGGRAASTLTEENVLVGNRKVLHRIRVFLNNMNISDVVSHVAIEACKKQISFSHCEKEKVNFSRNEIIELERRIALLGRYIIHRIKRGTMRIIIAHTLTLDVTFALDVLVLVVGGAAGPGAAHAEHDDQEQDGRGRPHHHPDHNLEHSDWLSGRNTEL